MGYCEWIEMVSDYTKGSFRVAERITGYWPTQVNKREERSGSEKDPEGRPKLSLAICST